MLALSLTISSVTAPSMLNVTVPFRIVGCPALSLIGKTASQSSTYGKSFPAYHAIDGKIDTISHTGKS